MLETIEAVVNSELSLVAVLAALRVASLADTLAEGAFAGDPVSALTVVTLSFATTQLW